MSTLNYKGKTISIPNGYSQTDVLKSLQKGPDVYFTSFHSTEFSNLLEIQNYPNRKKYFKKAKDNVYVIEFNNGYNNSNNKIKRNFWDLLKKND